MRQSAPYAVIGLGVIAMAGIAWWFGFRNQANVVPEAAQSPAIELSEGLAIYTSGEQGFLLAYPEGAEVSETFDTQRLPNAWSVSATTQGTSLLSITTYRLENETSYPRDYTVLLRIGKSEEPEDLRSCAEARNGEMKVEDRSIGGEPWAAFIYGDAAMMQYVAAESYRVVHEEACWAIEAVRTGSSYRENPTSADISDEALAAEFERLDTIVDSFRFAR
ncbi:MAG TPA: hypothetical protein VEA92_02170 [Candidatus Paceibacterota bacterium]|nr:hypothetical protein [Candidatus Paceibacterota bacterium]